MVHAVPLASGPRSALLGSNCLCILNQSTRPAIATIIMGDSSLSTFSLARQKMGLLCAGVRRPSPLLNSPSQGVHEHHLVIQQNREKPIQQSTELRIVTWKAPEERTPCLPSSLLLLLYKQTGMSKAECMTQGWVHKATNEEHVHLRSCYVLCSLVPRGCNIILRNRDPSFSWIETGADITHHLLAPRGSLVFWGVTQYCRYSG